MTSQFDKLLRDLAAKKMLDRIQLHEYDFTFSVRRLQMRYTFLGDKHSDPALTGMQCDPVRRPDGRCIVSTKMATALVVDEFGRRFVVPRRRLRLNR